jgi:hypothetical protein
VDDALFRPEVREAFHRLTGQGWTDALRALHPNERIYTFWKYFRNAFARDAGLRIDHLLLSPPRPAAWSRPGSTVRRGDASMPAITRPPGSKLRTRRAGLRAGGDARSLAHLDNSQVGGTTAAYALFSSR